MLDDDPLARSLIAKALGTAVDRAVRQHIDGFTQEAQLTARIGQTLEETLNGKLLLDHHVRIVTQDIPDRGPGALERDLGADLYVGIEVGKGRVRETKGFFVQAKLKRKLANSMRRKDLTQACEGMLDRTEASYVWIYGENGVRVLGAKQIVDAGRTRLQNLPARRATTLFARTLECREGEPSLGLPAVRSGREMRTALGSLLREFQTPRGIAVSIDRRS